MRDPNRIYGYMNRLMAIWQEVPDWRFGQLMCNFITSLNYDTFYMEDDKLFNMFEEFIKEVKGENNE